MATNPPKQKPEDPPANPPAIRAEQPLVVDTIHDLHRDHRDPQHQDVQQNLAVALLPLAVISLLVLAFIAAAWTFLAALPPA